MDASLAHELNSFIYSVLYQQLQHLSLNNHVLCHSTNWTWFIKPSLSLEIAGAAGSNGGKEETSGQISASKETRKWPLVLVLMHGVLTQLPGSTWSMHASLAHELKSLIYFVISNLGISALITTYTLPLSPKWMDRVYQA